MRSVPRLSGMMSPKEGQYMREWWEFEGKKMYILYLVVHFSHSLMFNSLRPHGLQRARLPSLHPTPGACSNSAALSRCCHPIISSSVILFSSCPHYFPASGSFPVSQFFASSYQSIGASALALPMNIQDWFSLGLTDLISLQPKGLSRTFSNTKVQEHQFFGIQYSLWSNSHIHTWLLKKTIALTRCIFVDKVMSAF